MTEQKEMHTALSVAYVDFGGNTGKGKYLYRFEPDLMIVGGENRNVIIKYAFDSAVPFSFRIRNLISSDSQNQVSQIKIDPDGRWTSFVNANDRPTLIFFTVIVEDMERKVTFSCDPQVGNDPQISPQ
ncbi:hypothetical protein LL972_11325 [Xanthomonas campestris pv. asclepiadis]|uniref:hypothetical protein n=1 Tax=Xanthomonas campestris TaxID=339 RepID=UPI001E465927|nr:hypothetical protein [Xanthomonas campestris]MCC4616584.1 hypothetical protein [Xanthomonas campestris pv. asclepiadis]